jgi:hypothetical protein
MLGGTVALETNSAASTTEAEPNLTTALTRSVALLQPGTTQPSRTKMLKAVLEIVGANDNTSTAEPL